MCLQYRSFEKEELLVMSKFSFYPTVISTLLEDFLPFSSNLKLSSPNSFNLESLNFVVMKRVNVVSTNAFNLDMSDKISYDEELTGSYDIIIIDR